MWGPGAEERIQPPRPPQPPSKGVPVASNSSGWEYSVLDLLPFWRQLQNHTRTTSFTSPSCLAMLVICCREDFGHFRNMFSKLHLTLFSMLEEFSSQPAPGSPICIFPKGSLLVGFLHPLLQKGPQFTHAAGPQRDKWLSG